MDVDPNYDPSDFLMTGLPRKQEAVPVDPQDSGMKIHDDLAVSESEDEGMNVSQETSQEEEEGEVWF